MNNSFLSKDVAVEAAVVFAKASLGLFIGRRANPLTRLAHKTYTYMNKMLHVLWSITTLFYKQWNCQVHCFLLIQLVCEY